MQLTESPADRSLAAAQRRARRFVLGTFIFFVLVFIGVSAYEIIAAAVGVPVASQVTPPASLSDSDREASRECADGVRALADAVDRAALGALGALDEAAATSHFRESLAGTWDPREKPTEAACSAVARGRDAFAAVLRFRQAQEGFVRRQVVEIAPLRRAVYAYLPR